MCYLDCSVFCQELLHKISGVCWGSVMMMHSARGRPQHRSFSANSLSYSPHDVQVKLLVHCLVLGSVLMMHNSICIEKHNNMTLIAPVVLSLAEENREFSIVTTAALFRDRIRKLTTHP
ncbi:hypothetical protein TNCV_2881891 [Trichonephila clavipes]|nr:hypothetical protein TNCV_2881891 [Trichonephila clavipes]